MNEVWLGERIRTPSRRPVVRRIPERLPTELVEERLRRLVELRHPALVQILDWGRDKRGHLFVLREEVAGEPLFAYAERHRLDDATRLRLFEEAAEALRIAHRAGVVHGRLSARKILVSNREGRPVARLVGLEKGPRHLRFAPKDDLREMEEIRAQLAGAAAHRLRHTQGRSLGALFRRGLSALFKGHARPVT